MTRGAAEKLLTDLCDALEVLDTGRVGEAREMLETVSEDIVLELAFMIADEQLDKEQL